MNINVVGELLITSTRGGNADVYSLDRDRPNTIHQVTDISGSELSATYSPDGTKILYVSDQGTNLDIYVVDADGSNPIQLTTTPALEGAPAWTPDGSHIVYESDQSGSSQIWIMNADGTEPGQITQGELPNYRPSVSPDGQRIIYASSRDDNYDIFLMNIDGSNEENLTETPWNEMVPVWINDTSIAFIQESGRGRNLTRVIVRLELNASRDLMALSQGLMVTDFAISSAGDMLALIVSAQGSHGVENSLYLLPVEQGAALIEVPRANTGDQLVSPSFRRR